MFVPLSLHTFQCCTIMIKRHRQIFIDSIYYRTNGRCLCATNHIYTICIRYWYDLTHSLIISISKMKCSRIQCKHKWIIMKKNHEKRHFIVRNSIKKEKFQVERFARGLWTPKTNINLHVEILEKVLFTCMSQWRLMVYTVHSKKEFIIN